MLSKSRNAAPGQTQLIKSWKSSEDGEKQPDTFFCFVYDNSSFSWAWFRTKRGPLIEAQLVPWYRGSVKWGHARQAGAPALLVYFTAVQWIMVNAPPGYYWVTSVLSRSCLPTPGLNSQIHSSPARRGTWNGVAQYYRVSVASTWNWYSRTPLS